MTAKPFLLRTELAGAWIALIAGCGQTPPPPAPATPPAVSHAVPADVVEPPAVPADPLRVRLPSGSLIEVRGHEEGSVAESDGVLTLAGGSKLNVSCRVPWDRDLPKLWRVVFFWKVEDGQKESEIASVIPKEVTKNGENAEFTVELTLGRIPTTPACRMKIQRHDGVRWSDVDVLEGITVANW